jgi:hypothetical protein
MSISTEFFKLRMGNIRGGANIIAAKDQAKLLITLRMLSKLQPLLVRIPYRTGNLYGAIWARLMSSPPGKVDIGAPGVAYAGYVNDMDPPKHWTNVQSVYHWFEYLMKKAEGFWMPTIREIMRQVGLDKLTGMSAGELAEMVAE